MAELGNGELLKRLARRGDQGAFAWELDPENDRSISQARSISQRLRHMADNPPGPARVERVVDPLYPAATKFRVVEAARASFLAAESGEES